ncbi:MAG: hypothetical protein JWN17_2965 [Frankiales bacterium]|nr:hypothetical protein [Frankiales bacterium]
MIRVLVVDDQELVRTGFTLILQAEPDLTVVGTAADGDDAVRRCRALTPDVVLMDIRMPGKDGITATAEILMLRPAPRVLILTTFDLDEHVSAALRAGASGFVLKDIRADALAEAIRTVHAGEALLAPSVTRRLIEDYLSRAQSKPVRDLRALTGREREVLALIGQGLSNREIAGRLVVAETTVKTHVGRVLAKLQLRDRVHAVIAAYDAGLT